MALVLEKANFLNDEFCNDKSRINAEITQDERKAGLGVLEIVVKHSNSFEYTPKTGR